MSFFSFFFDAAKTEKLQMKGKSNRTYFGLMLPNLVTLAWLFFGGYGLI